ncbi:MULTISPECIES: hypothetical protein [Aminobacterium]|jgi:hypothetical protein|uniref:hypothetical protein n=1 Tax=Aminobacterium TaxID=81466 RepID=UPI0004672D13|nr:MULTISPECIES: hypothetical protein [Aminobacterium]
MRKGLYFWGAFISCFVIIGLAILFIGRQPEQRTVSAPIPTPEASTPYVYVEGEGKVFSFPIPSDLMEEAEQARPFLQVTQSVSPFLSYSRQGACLVAWRDNQPHLYAAALFNLTTTQSLEKGAIPEEWSSLKDAISLVRDEKGTTRLDWGKDMPSLYVVVDGGLSLFSTSLEDLGHMKIILKNEEEKFKTDWKVSRDWKNHFRFYDGGLLSQLLSLDGFDVTLVPCALDASWVENSERGEFKWKISGIEALIPSQILGSLSTSRWDYRMIIPEPLVFAAGINLPNMEGLPIEEEILSEISADFPLTQQELFSLLKGPVSLTVGGNSKILFFTLPGFLVQFPERGAVGQKLAEAFWDQEWRMLVPSVHPLEGFPAGGTTDIPFTIVGVANDNLAAFGVIQKNDVKEGRKASIVIPSLKGTSEAFAWLYGDGQRLAEALEMIARASALAGKMGSEVGHSAEELAQIAANLRKVGEISIVMPNIHEGHVRWSFPAKSETLENDSNI